MSAFTTASDIWSVGCTVLELLTGVPPYFNLTQMSALYHVVNDRHPPLPDGISEELASFLMRCFDKNITTRATAAELSEHRWLTSAATSQLAFSDLSADLPDFMKDPYLTTLDEQSWISSEETGRDEGESKTGAGAGAGAREGHRGSWGAGRAGPGTEERRRPHSFHEGLTPMAVAGAPVADQARYLGIDSPLCGFLWKRGTSRIGKLAFYKRYFYIKDGALCYCSGRSDSMIQQNLEKRIPLNSISSIDVSSPARFEFHMRSDDRLYQFRSRTQREMLVWVNTLRELQQRHMGVFAHNYSGRTVAGRTASHESFVGLKSSSGKLSNSPAALVGVDPAAAEGAQAGASPLAAHRPLPTARADAPAGQQGQTAPRGLKGTPHGHGGSLGRHATRPKGLSSSPAPAHITMTPQAQAPA